MWFLEDRGLQVRDAVIFLLGGAEQFIKLLFIIVEFIEQQFVVEQFFKLFVVLLVIEPEFVLFVEQQFVEFFKLVVVLIVIEQQQFVLKFFVLFVEQQFVEFFKLVLLIVEQQFVEPFIVEQFFKLPRCLHAAAVRVVLGNLQLLQLRGCMGRIAKSVQYGFGPPWPVIRSADRCFRRNAVGCWRLQPVGHRIEHLRRDRLFGIVDHRSRRLRRRQFVVEQQFKRPDLLTAVYFAAVLDHRHAAEQATVVEQFDPARKLFGVHADAGDVDLAHQRIDEEEFTALALDVQSIVGVLEGAAVDADAVMYRIGDSDERVVVHVTAERQTTVETAVMDVEQRLAIGGLGEVDAIEQAADALEVLTAQAA